MHLTNYSINKNSENFVRDEDTGSKRWVHAGSGLLFLKRGLPTFIVMFWPLFVRKLSTLNRHLESLNCNTEKMWEDIEDIIIKTLISAHPILKHNYHTCFPNHTAGSACFEILGFDVLLDHRLKPWVLEVSGWGSYVLRGCILSTNIQNQELKLVDVFVLFCFINLLRTGMDITFWVKFGLHYHSSYPCITGTLWRGWAQIWAQVLRG